MKKIFHYSLVALVFLSNVLILILDSGRLGFGNLSIALLGVGMTYLGLGLWLWGFFSLGSSFALFTKTDKLVKRGIYKYLKHPIYLGIFFTFTGIALAKGSWLGLFFNLFITTTLNIVRAHSEEKALSEKFSSY